MKHNRKKHSFLASVVRHGDCRKDSQLLNLKHSSVRPPYWLKFIMFVQLSYMHLSAKATKNSNRKSEKKLFGVEFNALNVFSSFGPNLNI